MRLTRKDPMRQVLVRKRATGEGNLRASFCFRAPGGSGSNSILLP